MQMHVQVCLHFYAAKTRVCIRAAISDEPLEAEQLIHLFQVWVEADEVRAGEESLAARFVCQAKERPLPVAHFKATECTHPHRRRVKREYRDRAALGLAYSAVQVNGKRGACAAKSM